MSKSLVPIAVFSYNRLTHLEKCIESLKRNALSCESELYVFSDGPKTVGDEIKVDKIRTFIKKINGFKQVKYHFADKNKGLASSIISGVSEVIEEHGKIIVLEDDLTVSHDFIDYMNKALEFYEEQERVFSISAYCAPIQFNNYDKDVFFYQRINSWGWGTWRNRWNLVDWELNDFDSFLSDKFKRWEFNSGGTDLTMMLLKYKMGLIDSWAIRFNYACFKRNKLNLYPVKSKILNLGTDDSGTHTRKSTKFDTLISSEEVTFVDLIEENEKIKITYSAFLSPSIFRRLINKYKIWRFLLKNDLNK